MGTLFTHSQICIVTRSRCRTDLTLLRGRVVKRFLLSTRLTSLRINIVHRHITWTCLTSPCLQTKHWPFWRARSTLVSLGVIIWRLYWADVGRQSRRINGIALTLECLVIKDCICGTCSALVYGSVVIGLVRRAETDIVGGDALGGVLGADGLVLGTGLACFLWGDQGFIYGTLDLNAAFLVV